MKLNTGTEKLIAYKEGPVGWIVFNNPEKRNAITMEMQEAMTVALDDYASDPAIRLVVLRGEGEKAFISGGDISSFGATRGTLEGVRTGDAIGQRADRALQECPKPTIAMIRGYCMGGGMRIALGCDLRIGADDTRIGIPAAKLGVGYRFAGVKRLADLVGTSNACDIFYSARQYNAAEAKAMGFLNYVVPAAELQKFVEDYAATIANNAPLTITAVKRCVVELHKAPGERDLTSCEQAVDNCFASQDYIEGRTAFGEKRKPSFTGR